MAKKIRKTELCTKFDVYEYFKNENTTNIEIYEGLKHEIIKNMTCVIDYEKILDIKTVLKKMKLFEFEISQLIDIWPKSLLCLQLVLEEMEERYTEEQLITILNLFS